MNRRARFRYPPDVMIGSIVGHEVRRCGVPAVAVLAGTAAAVALVLVAVPSGWVGRQAIAVFPLAVGMAAAMVVGGEAALELHLTLPTPYPHTLLRRLAALLGSAAIGLAGLVAVLAAAGRAGDPVRVLVDTSGLVALLTGAAVWAAVVLGSAGASSSVVLTAWLAKLLVLDGVFRGSAVGAGVAVLGGVALLVAARARLDDPEHLTRAAVA